MNNYILDNQLILDLLVPRIDEYPSSLIVLKIIRNKSIHLFLAVTQIETLEYVLYQEKRRKGFTVSRQDIKDLTIKFFSTLTLIKTPSYIDTEDHLFQNDSEDYLIELSARNIDAKIISRDKKFLKNSELTISIDEFLKLEHFDNEEIKFLNIKSQYLFIQNEIDKAIDQQISKAKFINAKQNQQFEQEFAISQQVKHCIGVGNGTDALEIAIEALALPKCSEIIVPANTFIASAEAVTRAGHKVVFCDCECDNYTISIQSIREKLSRKTAAIMVVHLYGHPCDMDAVMAIAKENNLKIIEDCAQAHAAEYKNKRVGGIADIGCFSFYPGKNLGAYGDAGAIVTNDKFLAEKCKMLANHGRIDKYEHQFEGRNSRLDSIQAAILSVKLRHLDDWTKTRITIATYYIEKLKNCSGVVLPVCEPWAKHVYHLFVIQIDKDRDGLLNFLKSRGIDVSIHYPFALSKLPTYCYLKQYDEPFQAHILGDKLLSLPMGEHLDEDQVDIITLAIKEYLQEAGN